MWGVCCPNKHNSHSYDASDLLVIVHGPEGPLSLKELNQYFSGRQKENLPEIIPLILEASRR